MRLTTCAALVAVCCAGLVAQQPGDPKPLKVGDVAPNFTLTATTGGKVTLADYKGKNVVVVAFYSGRIHRWLNERIHSIPGWYCKI